MNWMIDGAHGDLYRKAMGHKTLVETSDEWEAERNSHTASRPRRAAADLARRLAANFIRRAASILIASTTGETVS